MIALAFSRFLTTDNGSSADRGLLASMECPRRHHSSSLDQTRADLVPPLPDCKEDGLGELDQGAHDLGDGDRPVQAVLDGNP